MNRLETIYLLKRACAHRRLGQVANSREARAIHRQFVKNYQSLLLAIRRLRRSPARPAPSAKTIGAEVLRSRSSAAAVAGSQARRLLSIQPSFKEMLA